MVHCVCVCVCVFMYVRLCVCVCELTDTQCNVKLQSAHSAGLVVYSAESEACGNGRLTEGGRREWGDLQLTVLPQRSKVDEYDTDLWTFIDRSKWVDGWKYIDREVERRAWMM